MPQSPDSSLPDSHKAILSATDLAAILVTYDPEKHELRVAANFENPEYLKIMLSRAFENVVEKYAVESAQQELAQGGTVKW